MTELTNEDIDNIISLLFYNWGERLIQSRIYGFDDSELILLLTSKYRKKWNEALDSLNEPLGATESIQKQDTQTLEGTLIGKNSTTYSESAINTDTFIDLDSTSNNGDQQQDRTVTTESEEIKIDHTLKNIQLLERKNDLCYTIAKDIVNEVTLKNY